MTLTNSIQTHGGSHPEATRSRSGGAGSPSRRSRGRRGLTLLVTGVATVGLAAPALAVTVTMGNPATDRGSVDTWMDSTTVDTNNPARFDGYFTQIDYFAERSGEMRFVIVDASGTVTWLSEAVTVTSAGADTLELEDPVGVTAGSNLGVYSSGDPVISFDYDESGSLILQTGGDGQPVVNSDPAFVAPDGLYQPNRIYSMNADIDAASPQICKNGGWEKYGYTNQGQCIASVVANENSGH